MEGLTGSLHYVMRNMIVLMRRDGYGSQLYIKAEAVISNGMFTDQNGYEETLTLFTKILHETRFDGGNEHRLSKTSFFFTRQSP